MEIRNTVQLILIISEFIVYWNSAFIFFQRFRFTVCKAWVGCIFVIATAVDKQCQILFCFWKALKCISFSEQGVLNHWHDWNDHLVVVVSFIFFSWTTVHWTMNVMDWIVYIYTYIHVYKHSLFVTYDFVWFIVTFSLFWSLVIR